MASSWPKTVRLRDAYPPRVSAFPGGVRSLADALRAQQGRVHTLIIPGVGHSLVGVDQAATEAANKMALEATLTFLRQNL